MPTAGPLAATERARWLGRLAFVAPFGVFVLLAGVESYETLAVPGRSFRGTPAPVIARGRALRERLEQDVRVLSESIGERNVGHLDALRRARDHVASRFGETGRAPTLEPFDASGVQVENVVLELRGTSRAGEIVVVGAHYDSAAGTPGADDDATGTAAVLSLAERAATRPRARTVRFVAFVNEEPPYFQGPRMGSLVHARRARRRGDDIVGMLSLEMLGCFSDAPGSQRYPFPLGVAFPSTGNFLAFVSNRTSRDWLWLVVGAFRDSAQVPSEGVAPPETTLGAGWSDHWSFWEAGYPALMVTDTSLFRYAHYHSPRDVPRELDFERMARAVEGLDAVLERVTR